MSKIKTLANERFIEGNIIEEYMLGNTKIMIADGYLPKTKEENDAVIASLAKTLGNLFGCEVIITHEQKKC